MRWHASAGLSALVPCLSLTWSLASPASRPCSEELKAAGWRRSVEYITHYEHYGAVSRMRVDYSVAQSISDRHKQ